MVAVAAVAGRRVLIRQRTILFLRIGPVAMVPPAFLLWAIADRAAGTEKPGPPPG